MQFYFDLSDESRERDEVGVDLPSAAAAELEAIRFLGEVLSYEPKRLSAGTLRVDVGNDQREIIFSIDVVAGVR